MRSMQPLSGAERDVSGRILPRTVHVNENMAPTNFPGEPCFPTQPKSRAPKMAYSVYFCIYMSPTSFTFAKFTSKSNGSRLTNKACRQPPFFCWKLSQNESYVTFLFQSICHFILFWELKSHRTSG